MWCEKKGYVFFFFNRHTQNLGDDLRVVTMLSDFHDDRLLYWYLWVRSHAILMTFEFFSACWHTESKKDSTRWTLRLQSSFGRIFRSDIKKEGYVSDKGYVDGYVTDRVPSVVDDHWNNHSPSHVYDCCLPVLWTIWSGKHLECLKGSETSDQDESIVFGIIDRDDHHTHVLKIPPQFVATKPSAIETAFL